jgi:hypothetical protein
MRRMKPNVYWMSMMLAYLLGQEVPDPRTGRRRVRGLTRSGAWRVQRVH